MVLALQDAAAAPWWETSQLWVSVALLLAVCALGALVWQALARLRALEAHLSRLDILEKVSGTLSGLAEGQASLDLRRVEHILTDMRDGQGRLEDALVTRLYSTPQGSSSAAPRSGPEDDEARAADLAERIVNRLLSQGFERVRLLLPVSELAVQLARSGGEAQSAEVPLEAHRHGGLVKGRAVVRAGVIEEVSIQENYGAFP
ncbi:MAG: hypothetical protein QF724_13125 [Planctomycetota bacterium]|jgi:hypothetical protein|nr:hypothetical protein [Planctomycetota bacterium]